MPVKKKTKTLSDYKKDAWKSCSLYIRLKYADENGYESCVTCGKTDHYKKMQAGHFTQGRRGLNFFCETNIHPQCYGCNIMKSGNLIKYWPFMLKKYGQEVIDELLLNDEKEKRYQIDELIEIKNNFDEKAKKLLTLL